MNKSLYIRLGVDIVLFAIVFSLLKDELQKREWLVLIFLIVLTSFSYLLIWFESKTKDKGTRFWYVLGGLVEARGYTTFYLLLLLVFAIIILLLLYFR